MTEKIKKSAVESQKKRLNLKKNHPQRNAGENLKEERLLKKK